MSKLSNKNIKDYCKYFIMTVMLLFIFTGCNYNKTYYDYYNNEAIVNTDKYNARSLSTNYSDDNRVITGKAGKLDGCLILAQTNIENEIDSEIYISISAKRGKAKLVLVKPNSDIEVLKEVTAENENSYDGNIPIHCDVGETKIKIVADNYSGEFKISQNKNLLFTNYLSDFPFESESELLDEDSPFNSKDKTI